MTDWQGGRAIPIVTLGPGASQAITSLLSERGLPASIRIDTSFTGCCDASLALIAGPQCEGDLVYPIDGITFVISPDVYRLSGDINIEYIDEQGKKGYSITSSKPISEWEGFGVCDIKV